MPFTKIGPANLHYAIIWRVRNDFADRQSARTALSEAVIRIR
jgi:hypothetical protein